MTTSLERVSITDYRSIKGTVDLPLNAPIVLLHGPNGAGKTSVLSAIELALTGEILSMARTDAKYRAHLIHHGAATSQISISLGEWKEHQKSNISIVNDRLSGSYLLTDAEKRFFSERCYLAQSTLGRLLDIYQNSDPKGVSPLTHFVNDLLGLNSLDALIDGLFSQSDARNTRRLCLQYQNVESELGQIATRLQLLLSRFKQTTEEIQKLQLQIKALWPDFNDDPQSALSGKSDSIEESLSTSQGEAQIIALKRLSMDLDSIKARFNAAQSDAATLTEAKATQEAKIANNALAEWRQTEGTQIEAVINLLSRYFSDLPSVNASGASIAFETAVRRAEGECQRCHQSLEQDNALIRQLTMLDRTELESSRRIQEADNELASLTRDAEDISASLTEVIPHIHDGKCPVCDRDFREVSQTSLVEYVSLKATSLAAQGRRVGTISRDRQTAMHMRASIHSERELLKSRCLDNATREVLKARLADLLECRTRLRDLEDSVTHGADLMRKSTLSNDILQKLRYGQRVTLETRASIERMCVEAELPSFSGTEGISEGIARIEQSIDGRMAQVTERMRKQRELSDVYHTYRSKKLEMVELSRRITDEIKLKGEMEAAFGRSENRRKEGRVIAKQAKHVRTEIVRHVFNGSLNSIWRDLFVRLAPGEAFVPAFKVPESEGGPASAQLETRHRDGRTGGSPGAMLSAGNLNTAALTLFIALHLVVGPSMPLLVLDDPVQSMDEIHISHFAALLRTLSKSHNRQIVIAVHERSLFEYLRLELSPAFHGDRLITLELTRTGDGNSVAESSLLTWVQDRAVAA